MESEIPSFRDAKPHESWELVPLDELSLSGILQLRNRRFLVSGMQSPMSLGSSASFRRIVPFRDTSTMESKIPSFRDAKPKQSWLLKRIASPLQGFAMTTTAYTFCSRF